MGVTLCACQLDVSDMENEANQDQSRNRTAVWLALAAAAVGLLSLIFKESFVIGKRGFDFAHGEVAQIVGFYWLLISASLLVTTVSSAVLRKRLFALIGVAFFGGFVGIFCYFIYAAR